MKGSGPGLIEGTISAFPLGTEETAVNLSIVGVSDENRNVDLPNSIYKLDRLNLPTRYIIQQNSTYLDAGYSDR